MKEFNVSLEISYLVTTLFLVGYVVGVNFFQPFSRFLSNYHSSLYSGVQEANFLDVNKYPSCRWSFILYFSWDKPSHVI